MLFKMEMKQKINENAVENRVKQFLIESGYTLRDTVRVKGRYPDIVAIKDNKISMIEVKGSMGDIRAGIAQALQFCHGAHFSYLAIPESRSSKKLRETLENLGIGLIEVNDLVKITVFPVEAKPLESIRKRVIGKPGKEKRRGVPTRRGILTKISKHRGVVRILLRYPNRTFTIRELSRNANIPYATVWRFINDLYTIGIVSLNRIGGSLACKLNTKSLFLAEVEKIIGIEPSPHRLAAKEFTKKVKNIPEVKRVILFGSVARGEEKPESDVDIAVILSDKRAEEKINKITDEILSTSRIKIILLILTWKEIMENPQFKEELEKGEVIYERDKRG